jgi:hypothetical protein
MQSADFAYEARVLSMDDAGLPFLRYIDLDNEDVMLRVVEHLNKAISTNSDHMDHLMYNAQDRVDLYRQLADERQDLLEDRRTYINRLNHLRSARFAQG